VNAHVGVSSTPPHVSMIAIAAGCRRLEYAKNQQRIAKHRANDLTPRAIKVMRHKAQTLRLR
jgi:hypothetical protein